MKNAFGVDKVGLYLPHTLIEVSKDSLVEIQSKKALNDTREAPFLFVTACGQPVHGNKGMLNTETFNFSVVESGCLLQFNPSKPYHPYELCGSSDTFIERVDTVINQLAALGVSGAWEEAKLTRLDFAKNFQLDAPLSNYTQCLNLVNFARSRRQAEFPDGYMTGNNSRGLIIYNKSIESNLSLIHI